MSQDFHDQMSQQSGNLRRQLILSWVLMLLLVFLLLLPTLKLWLQLGVSGTPRPITPRGELANFEQTTIDLFREASPSVVYINTLSARVDPFRRRVREESGTGSGFVWDDQGHIVTNYHVVQEATSAQVVFFDQSSYEAVAVGASPEHDLAVLRIDAPKNLLRPVLIGESHDLAVGQSVYAIGNPFGLDQTLTTGIISAKSRTIESPSGAPIKDVIQIDAAINPGNSGGPLLDSAGRLVGVNTAIYSPSGASAGVGFSIPVDVVNRVVPLIIEKGRYEPPYLGIYTTETDNEIAKQFYGIQGVLVLQVESGGPAERAGLRGTVNTTRGRRLGDVIEQINGTSVNSVRELEDALQQYNAGDSVSVTFLRGRERRQVDIQLQ